MTAISRLEVILSARGATLSGARVLLIGVGFKVDSPDTTASPAREVVRLLRSRGAVPVYTDSKVLEFDVDGPLQSVTAADLEHEQFDACLVLSGDRAVSGAAIARAAAVVLDTGGGRLSPGGMEGVYTL
jgi:UDP-N-acetyl-D-glucosamine dehydrogenase